ncbi:hypothetical protein TrVE_jg9000 [Triparma verrucosa]|uniref:Myb-like domain-containing protein n=1 Tax=Triparma verrucosa TaxID=1606542 RepID=A0A9W7KX82_9STRA|nr:hypothetical protein TrVE_jg9000 [Triparma verrucosa]
MPMSKKTTKKTKKAFNVQLNTNRLHYNTTTPTTTGPVVEATKDEVDLSRFKGKRLKRILKQRAKNSQTSSLESSGVTSPAALISASYAASFAPPSPSTKKKKKKKNQTSPPLLSDVDLLNSFSFDVPPSFYRTALSTSLDSSPQIVTDTSSSSSPAFKKIKKRFIGDSLLCGLPDPSSKVLHEPESPPSPVYPSTRYENARPYSLIYNPNYGVNSDSDSEDEITRAPVKLAMGSGGFEGKKKYYMIYDKGCDEWLEKYKGTTGVDDVWNERMLNDLRKAFNKGSRDIRSIDFWKDVGNEVGVDGEECERKWKSLIGTKKLTGTEKYDIVQVKRRREIEMNNLGDSIYDVVTPSKRKKRKVDDVLDIFGSAIKASPAACNVEELEEEVERVFEEEEGVDWCDKRFERYLGGFGQRKRFKRTERGVSVQYPKLKASSVPSSSVSSFVESVPKITMKNSPIKGSSKGIKAVLTPGGSFRVEENQEMKREREEEEEEFEYDEDGNIIFDGDGM